MPQNGLQYASLGQNFFIIWFTIPPTVIFCKVEKNNF